MAELETINIGIFGHIDHGKTTLLQKLSGKWTDTHSEELKRGITIKLGYADIIIYFDSKEGYNISRKGEKVRHVSFIDAPGHEMLMATMLSGAALVDAAILVIAANEGIKPQTSEHLMALKAKKVENLIVVQNKIDLVDEKTARASYDSIRKFLGKEYEKVEIIPVSAQQGINIDEVLRAICEIKVGERDLKSAPVFVIARSFDINRPGSLPKDLKGAVLGGSLKRGRLNVGDEIEIKPGRREKDDVGVKFFPIKTRIKGLFVGSENVSELTPGGSAAIETGLDMALGKADALSGNLASTVNGLPKAVSNMKLKYKLFPEVFGTGGHLKVEEIKKGETLMLSINTSVVGGNVVHITDSELEVSLKVPAIVFSEDNLGIARNVKGHWRLVGYGVVC